MRHRILSVVLYVLLCVAAAGCGQKGPLFLPGQDAAEEGQAPPGDDGSQR